MRTYFERRVIILQSFLLYNEEDKKEYIEFERKNSDAVRRYFQRIYEKENEYKKDIYDMNRDELFDTITSLNIRREESRSHLISLLRGYITWAKLYGKTKNESHINNITPESINSRETIKIQMLKNPGHLQEILDKSLNFIDYENRSKRDLLIFWLLYIGLELEEIQSLKKDSLNYESKIITVKSDKKIKADDKIAELWEHCVKMEYLEKKNSRAMYASRKFNVSEYTRQYLAENNYLIRPVSRKKDTNDCIPMATLRASMYSVFQDDSDDGKNTFKISPSNIRNSGIFYRLYMLESSGVEITPVVIAENFYIDYRNKSELLIKTRKWRIDYEDWKHAFDYV